MRYNNLNNTNNIFQQLNTTTTTIETTDEAVPLNLLLRDSSKDRTRVVFRKFRLDLVEQQYADGFGHFDRSWPEESTWMAFGTLRTDLVGGQCANGFGTFRSNLAEGRYADGFQDISTD